MADDNQPGPATDAVLDDSVAPATDGGGKSEIAGQLKDALKGGQPDVPKNPQAELRRKVEGALKGTQAKADTKPVEGDGRARRPDGTFAAKDEAQAAAQPAKPVEGTAKPADDKPAPVGSQAPTAWKKDVAAKHWPTMHPEAQAEILRREGDVAKLWEAHQQIKHAAPVVGFANEVAPKLGITGPVLMQQWAQFQAAVLDPAQKVQAAQWLLKQYGITLPGAAAPATDAAKPADEWKDPQVAALEKQLADLSKWKTDFEGQQQTWMQQAEQAMRHEKTTTFEKFAAEKGPDGQPLRPHLDDAVLTRMAPRIMELKTANPQLSDQDALAQAYDEAVWGNSTLRQGLLETQRLADEKKRNDEARARAQAARRPAVSPATASPQGPGSSAAIPKDVRTHLRQQLTRAQA